MTIPVGDSYCGNTYAGWLGLANATVGSPCLYYFWAGVGGETTTNVLSRIATVTALSPELAIVSCGINDIGQSVAATTIEANLTSIYTALTAIGCKVILCTVPPSNVMTAPMLTQLAALNTWMKALNVTNVYVADTGNALTTGDGVTQNAGLFADGVHPNFAGCAAMAAVLGPKITLATT
jgi:lysophospholipase L1-like esterase